MTLAIFAFIVAVTGFILGGAPVGPTLAVAALIAAVTLGVWAWRDRRAEP